MTRVTIEDKVGSWYTAFHAIRSELTTPGQRAAAQQQPTTQAEYDQVVVGLRVIAANDRTAALVAALLVGSGGTRPVPTDALTEDV